MDKEHLDELDKTIVALLAEDGQSSVNRMAEQAGVTGPTVRARMKNLVAKGVLAVTGLVNPFRTKGLTVALVGITIQDHKEMDAKLDQIAALDRVQWAAVVTGGFDILAEVLLSDEIADLYHFINQDLSQVRRGQVQRDLRGHAGAQQMGPAGPWSGQAVARTGRKEGAAMIVGTVTEIKNHEYRVGLVPAGVRALASAGHEVLVQQGAGLGSGIEDAEYAEAGRDPGAGHRTNLCPRRDGGQGQGAPGARVRAHPRGPDRVYLSAPGSGPGPHQGAFGARLHRRGLRDHPTGRRLPAPAHAHERGGRTQGRADRRLLPGQVPGRPGRAPGRRARRGARRG